MAAVSRCFSGDALQYATEELKGDEEMMQRALETMQLGLEIRSRSLDWLAG